MVPAPSAASSPVKLIGPKTQGELVVAVMDQSRTLACEVVDCGMVGEKECDTWRPRVCWTLSGDIRLPVGQKRRVAGVELDRSLGKREEQETAQSGVRSVRPDEYATRQAEVIDAMEALSY